MATNETYHELQKKLKQQKYEQLIVTLPRYVKSYTDTIFMSTERGTLLAYTYDIITFFKFLKDRNPACRYLEIKEIPVEILNMLTLEDMLEYQRYLIRTDDETDMETHINNAEAVNRKISALRGLFLHLVSERKLMTDPTAGLRKVKTHKKPIVKLTVDEAQDLIKAVATSNVSTKRQQMFCKKAQLRDLAIITLLLNTGIRVSECVGLDVDDFNFTKRTMRIIRKGGNADIIYLNESTMLAIQTYMDHEREQLVEGIEDTTTALFLSNRRQRMCVKAVENVVKKYASTTITDKTITCHKLRSTYGSNLYDVTGDIKLVADTLGHKSVDTTNKHYASASESHKKQAAEYDLFS